ncbi:hypothetical protein JTB14_015808 [Gonioctena quinquepunctata]|nr:hypothetical protein JTB14_015808 [Gonioctena quinquepunctata]
MQNVRPGNYGRILIPETPNNNKTHLATSCDGPFPLPSHPLFEPTVSIARLGINSLMVASQRKFDTKILASYEVFYYCKYLFDNDGFYRKSPKSQLVVEIQKNYICGTSTQQDIINLNTFKIYIVDGMALVHKIQLNNFNTFGDFAEAFFKKIMQFLTLPDVKRIDVIFDRYDDISIKFLESKLRIKGQIIKNVIISSHSTKIPADCKAFLANIQNKLQLVRFLCTNATKYAQVKEDCEMYICGGFDDPTKCFNLQGSLFCEVLELQSNHLEADSRMFCHMFHSVRIQSAHIIIISADTDVFILGIYFWKYLANIGCLGLWFDGSHTKKYFLGCHLAAESLGERICDILPALDAISVCDTTSRFDSKMQCLKAASEDFVQTALISLGNLDLNNEQLKQ